MHGRSYHTAADEVDDNRCVWLKNQISNLHPMIKLGEREKLKTNQHSLLSMGPGGQYVGGDPNQKTGGGFFTSFIINREISNDTPWKCGSEKMVSEFEAYFAG